MLTVWGRTASSNVQALMWCIGELGLPHERHDAGHRYGGTDTPEFLAMNPNGTVPVLRDGRRRAAVGDGRDPALPFRSLCGRAVLAAGRPARARVDKWAEWAKINVAMNFTAPIFWASCGRPRRIGTREPSTKPSRSWARRSTSPRRGSRVAPSWPGTTSRWRTSSSACAVPLLRHPDRAAGTPALRRYYEALTTRSAFREHVMMSYEELRVPG
jgi:glutathione S-transferase